MRRAGVQRTAFGPKAGDYRRIHYLDGMNRPLAFGSDVPLCEAFLRRWQ